MLLVGRDRQVVLAVRRDAVGGIALYTMGLALALAFGEVASAMFIAVALLTNVGNYRGANRLLEHDRRVS